MGGKERKSGAPTRLRWLLKPALAGAAGSILLSAIPDVTERASRRIPGTVAQGRDVLQERVDRTRLEPSPGLAARLGGTPRMSPGGPFILISTRGQGCWVVCGLGGGGTFCHYKSGT